MSLDLIVDEDNKNMMHRWNARSVMLNDALDLVSLIVCYHLCLFDPSCSPYCPIPSHHIHTSDSALCFASLSSTPLLPEEVLCRITGSTPTDSTVLCLLCPQGNTGWLCRVAGLEMIRVMSYATTSIAGLIGFSSGKTALRSW